MKRIKFGIIGCGLMGKEFASASMRWGHLPEMKARPEITVICDTNPELFGWFKDNLSTITQETTDYKELLANPDVEAVYVALPHNLHEQVYCDVINAGKHLMGEKPFGIDKSANKRINDCVKSNPNVIVRCATQYLFIPAVQRILAMMEAGDFGDIIEMRAGLLHSSDLNTEKPVNWKRMVKYCGEYGCMGDLGMHVCSVPFKMGWKPQNVRGILSNLVPNRPDGKGGMAPCETWDNAVMLCEMTHPNTGASFPCTMQVERIAPGEKNSWYVEIYGMKKCARMSTKNINAVEILDFSNGGEQAWQHIDMGNETAFKSITGVNLEFGFSDYVLQMWAAYIYELANGEPLNHTAECSTPEEVAWSHDLFTAVLESHKNRSTVAL